MTKREYVVKTRDGESHTFMAEHVHTDARGSVKFLNGKGAQALLVGMVHHEYVVSVKEVVA